MLSAIVMQCVGRFEFVEKRFTGWRCVEGQHTAPTMDLVDSNAEQDVLENILDNNKPPVPIDCIGLELHYLLFTPFRYPPLKHGSRFGDTTEPSLWYGSLDEKTALAETAYYRMRFFDDSDGDMHISSGTLCTFSVDLHSSACIDLTVKAFDDYQDEIRNPLSYSFTHAIGKEMRKIKAEMFLFFSARCIGTNFALFSPCCFENKVPTRTNHWSISFGKSRVILERKNGLNSRDCLTYRKSNFEINGVLPEPS